MKQSGVTSTRIDISGAVTVVARKGRLAHLEAQGLMDVDTKKAMSKDTLFWIASMSKPITGVAILMLVEEGKIRPHTGPGVEIHSRISRHEGSGDAGPASGRAPTRPGHSTAVLHRPGDA